MSVGKNNFHISDLCNTECVLGLEIDLSDSSYCLREVSSEIVVVPSLWGSGIFKILEITPAVDPWSSMTILVFKNCNKSIERGPGCMPKSKVLTWNNKLFPLLRGVRGSQGNNMPSMGA